MYEAYFASFSIRNPRNGLAHITKKVVAIKAVWDDGPTITGDCGHNPLHRQQRFIRVRDDTIRCQDRSLHDPKVS
jgi:hypothetical protein